MNIFKAYEMLIEAQAAPRRVAPDLADGRRGSEAPWLSANVYRVVSRTSELFDRFAAR